MAKRQAGAPAGALVVRRYGDRREAETATWVTAPQQESREAPPAALYLGRLMPNTRGPARYRLERIADMLSGGRVSAILFPWERITYSDVMNLRVALERQYPDSPGTRNNFLKNLRGVLRECWDAGYIEDRTYRRIINIPLFSVPRNGKRPGRHVEMAEVRKLLDSIGEDTRPVGRRDAAIVGALFSGLRRSEVAALTVADWTGQGFQVKNGKGGKSRTVPAHPDVARAVDAWLELRGHEDGALFLSFRGCNWSHGYQHMAPCSIRNILDTRIQAAGIERFRPHDARRSLIGYLLDGNVDIATVADLVGHTDIRTTRAYDHRPALRMAEAVESLPSLYG
jgi:integrase